MYLASAVNSSRTSFELPSHGPSGLNGNAGLGAKQIITRHYHFYFNRRLRGDSALSPISVLDSSTLAQ